MTSIDLLVQISAILSSPLVLYLIREVHQYKKSITGQVEKNTEANFGSDDPHNNWPGTVQLTQDNRRRSIENGARLDFHEGALRDAGLIEETPPGYPGSGGTNGAD